MSIKTYTHFMYAAPAHDGPGYDLDTGDPLTHNGVTCRWRGAHDRAQLYLVVDDQDHLIEPGETYSYLPEDPLDRARWNAKIAAAGKAFGYTLREEPGWFIVNHEA